MAETTYTYSVLTDTANGKVNLETLRDEIEASDSGITIQVLDVRADGNSLEIDFKDSIGGEEYALAQIVSDHEGEEELIPDVPTERDGRPVVVNAPMDKGKMTFFVGAGDDLDPTPPESGRGSGTQLNFTFTGPDTQTREMDFLECVGLHDGQLTYCPTGLGNWTHRDRLDFYARMPATQTTPNGGGTGNCNKFPTGLGYSVIVPAMGDGAYDVDLDAAVPVSAGGSGYWEVDLDSGEIVPTAGNAGYHLLDVDVKAYFMRNMPMGNPMGVLDVDTYKSEWIHKNWKLGIQIRRNTPGAGNWEASAWVLTYRENVT